MTGSDLIVMAPWIIFGASLLAVCVRLLRSRRRSGGQHTTGHPQFQEAQCPDKTHPRQR